METSIEYIAMHHLQIYLILIFISMCIFFIVTILYQESKISLINRNRLQLLSIALFLSTMIVLAMMLFFTPETLYIKFENVCMQQCITDSYTVT